MTVNGGDGEQPPEPGGAQPEPPQGPQEHPVTANGAVPAEQSAQEDGKRKVSPLRIAGYALLVVAVLAALVPILGLAAETPNAPERTTSADASRVAAEQTTTRKTTKKPPASKAKEKKKPSSNKSRKPKRSSPADAEVGPVIDSETNEQADATQTKRKLIVGGVALGLLVLVFWGRRARSVRRRKADKQSKGG